MLCEFHPLTGLTSQLFEVNKENREEVVLTFFSPEKLLITKVLVADDHQLVREIVSAFISEQPGFLASVAKNYQEVYTMLDREDVGVATHADKSLLAARAKA